MASIASIQVVGQVSKNVLGEITGNSAITHSSQFSSSEVSKVYAAARTLGGSPDVITLNNGSINDAFGTALTFATVRAVAISNTHNTNTVTVGGGSNPLMGSDQWTVKPGKVTATTSAFTISGSALQITVSGTTGTTYSIIVLGS